MAHVGPGSGLFADLDETAFWTGKELDALLDIWEQKAEAVSSHRNEAVMQEISEGLGGSKTSKQVRAKVKKLRCMYLLQKQKAEQGEKVKWRHYDRIAQIPHVTKGAGMKRPGLRGLLKKGSIDSSVTRVICDPSTPGTDRVTLSSDWTLWNSQQLFPLSTPGLQQLVRSGFRDTSHLELLKDKSLEPLKLTYHDQLALERALESMEASHYQVVSAGDGSLIEVKYIKSSGEKQAATPAVTTAPAAAAPAEVTPASKSS